MAEKPKKKKLIKISETDSQELSEAPAATPEIEGYRIIGKLGEGGMGSVWRAVQLSTHREVALKVMGAGAFGSEKAQGRFEREVELAACLQHSNVACVFESGLHHGLYYYAMELIDGKNLDDYVEQHDLTHQQILELMRTVCRAVQHAHQMGVIHRDLKPSNILVTEDGQPYVLDFGLAKTFTERDSNLTVSANGEIIGTLPYMSPEQAMGRHDQLDTRTDVYSLGSIMYRLLTGESPHDLSGTKYTVIRRIAEDEIRRPRSISSKINKELETLLLKCLEHDPDDRYASAGDLAKDINNYLNHEPLIAKAPKLLYFLRKRLYRHRRAVAIMLIITVALYAVFEVAVLRARRTRRSQLIALWHRTLDKFPFDVIPDPAGAGVSADELALWNPDGGTVTVDELEMSEVPNYFRVFKSVQSAFLEEFVDDPEARAIIENDVMFYLKLIAEKGFRLELQSSMGRPKTEEIVPVHQDTNDLSGKTNKSPGIGTHGQKAGNER